MKRHQRRTVWILSGCGAIALGYVALAGAFFWYVREKRQVATVSFADVALPSRWPSYQIKRGEHYIDQGMALLRSGHNNKGFGLLRIGLSKAPANRQARLVLAQIYTHSQRLDLAETVLLSGLPFHRNDLDYVGAVFQHYLSVGQYDQAISLARKLSGTTRGIAVLAARNAALASYHLGNYSQAEAFLKQHGLNQTRMGRLLGAKLDWERGYTDLALLRLEALRKAYPDDEAIHTLNQRYLRKAGHLNEARRLAVLHQIAHPKRPQSYLDQIWMAWADDNPPQMQKLARDMIAVFPNEPEALLALGDFAATNGQSSITTALLAHVRTMPTRIQTPLKLMAAEALINNGQYEAALDEIRQLQQSAHSNPRLSSACINLEAIARYAMGDIDAGRGALERILASSSLHADGWLAMASRFNRLRQAEPASRVLEHAAEQYPHNQRILLQLIRLYLVDAENIASCWL